MGTNSVMFAAAEKASGDSRLLDTRDETVMKKTIDTASGAADSSAESSKKG